MSIAMFVYQRVAHGLLSYCLQTCNLLRHVDSRKDPYCNLDSLETYSADLMRMLQDALFQIMLQVDYLLMITKNIATCFPK